MVAKLTLQEIPPMSLAFLRFCVALILLCPFLLTEKRNSKLETRDLPQLFVVGALMVTFNIAFFYLGLERTTTITAATLTMAIPALSVLLGWSILREKVYLINLLGIFTGLIGAVVIIGVPEIVLGTRQPSISSVIGNILVVFAALAWVAGATVSRNLLKKYSALTVTATIFTVGVMTFFAPALMEYMQDPAWPSRVTHMGLFGLLYIAFASSVSAYFLFEWGVAKLGIIKADLFQYLEPLVAAYFGVMLLGEQLTPLFLIGAVLVAVGVFWSTTGRPEHRHHKAHRN
ncbi:MAG: DMT family transporter [Firmicutes bacterium]|nr:DMT family transporter [Bacillota bacterium]